jgi:hypothetical protein
MRLQYTFVALRLLIKIRAEQYCLAGVVLQQPPEPFPTLDRVVTLSALAWPGKEYDIAFPLVWTLRMIMRFERRQGMPEGTLTKQDHPRQRFLLHRAHPALRIGVQIWRLRRERHARYTGNINDPLKRRTVFAISVMDEVLAG